MIYSRGVLDGIRENMASLFQSVMYDAINIDVNTSNAFYVVQFLLEVYMLQNDTKIV